MSLKQPTYFCNGKYLPADQATLSVRDLGICRGFGVFESVRTYNGIPFRLNPHLDRLFGSIRKTGLKSPWTQQMLTRIINQLLRKNRFKESLIRIIVTGGLTNSMLPTGKPSLVVLVDPMHLFPPAMYQKGIRMMSTSLSRIHPDIKSTVYFSAVIKSVEAVRRGFQEVVYLDHQKSILEGTTFNVFAVLPGPRLVTARENVLPGITATCVLEIAKKLKIPVQRSPISIGTLKRAKELFITSSNRELIPVVQLDRQKISNGKPGPMTQLLHREYLKVVESEC